MTCAARVRSKPVELSAADRARFLAAAKRLAQGVAESRYRARDGGIVWKIPLYSKEAQDYRLFPAGPHLYNGSCGIALFLAAWESVTGDGIYRELALEALTPIRRRLRALRRDPDSHRSLRLRIGAFEGLGSFIYSFVWIGSLLEEPDLVQEAWDTLALVTDRRIDEDRRFDVVSGCAGAILVLLRLVETEQARDGNAAAEDGIPLRLASSCAEHLLRHRVSIRGLPRAWPWPAAPNQSPLTGFAHGAAGISYALLRLYASTQEESLRQAALEGIEFERRMFHPKYKNWRDLRGEPERYMTAWCHGAPGVALGRLGILHLEDDEHIRQEIRDALETTLSRPRTHTDHLCCGNMGRTETLLTAYQTTRTPAYFEGAVALAHDVLDVRGDEDNYGWLPVGSPPYFDPSFAKGAAGVGYTFLRLAFPDHLPSILQVP